VACLPVINNCTIANNAAEPLYGRAGGIQGSCTGVNTIIYGNTAPQYPEIYEGYFLFTYSCCSTSITGTGNITSNPMFVDSAQSDYHLQAGSPCIDTGSPTWPLDPDSTRADMGALYFDQSVPPPPVSVTLTPINPPIQISPTGGSFNFNVAVTNNESTPQTFDAWIMVILPNGNPYGPVLGPVTLTLPAGLSLNRDRTQAVPGGAPSGTYGYTAYVGDYPGTVWDEDSFNFVKLSSEADLTAQPENSGRAEWLNWGEDFAVCESGAAISRAVEQTQLNAYPNPCNPETQLSFILPEASRVVLCVYDLQGREVARPADGWRSAGRHQLTWNAASLPSGVYLLQLTAGEYHTAQKIVLLK
jgi:hypothetical protein